MAAMGLSSAITTLSGLIMGIGKPSGPYIRYTTVTLLFIYRHFISLMTILGFIMGMGNPLGLLSGKVAIISVSSIIKIVIKLVLESVLSLISGTEW